MLYLTRLGFILASLALMGWQKALPEEVVRRLLAR